MTMPSLEPNGAVRPGRKRETLLQFQQRIVDENPGSADPWNTAALTEAASDAGVPRHIVAEALAWAFQLNRHHLDPTFERQRKQQAAPAPRPAVVAAERVQARTRALEQVKQSTRHALQATDADTVMADGRRLGDWTVAEVRKLGGVFSFLLKIAGKADDSRRVDAVMRKRDWQQVAKLER